MNRKLAYCGLDCYECDAYKATMNNDDELREKLAEIWSKNSGMEIDPADIGCSGCKSDGVQIGFCGECTIRHCAIKRGVDNCALCSSYKCEELEKFLQNLPSKANDNLESVRQNLNNNIMGS